MTTRLLLVAAGAHPNNNIPAISQLPITKPPPPDGPEIVIPLLPFRSNEFVAVGLPVNVVLLIAAQAMVEAPARFTVGLELTCTSPSKLLAEVPAHATGFVTVNAF